jgi:putative alpha-1,2-mannosidase
VHQDYGNFTVMPVSGELKFSAEARASSFSHANEHAHPLEYSVDRPDYAIHAEITGTSRSGLMRFRYDRPQAAWLVVQNNSRSSAQAGDAHIDSLREEVWGRNPVIVSTPEPGNLRASTGTL